MRTWSLIDTTDSHLIIAVVGNWRELPCDTHVILVSGACRGGTGSTPDRSRSVDDAGDDDGGQGSPILYIQTPDRPLQRLLLVVKIMIIMIVKIMLTTMLYGNGFKKHNQSLEANIINCNTVIRPYVSDYYSVSG